MTRVIASCTRGLAALPQRLSVADHGTGRAGDLVLARVRTIGAYPRLETTTGREVRLRPGDELVGVLGERHSSTSIYGGLPEGGLPIEPGAPIDLMAVGGVLGMAASSPGFLGTPTRLEMLGLVGDADHDGRLLSLVQRSAHGVAGVPVVFVGGTAAEVGKTTFASALVHRLATEHRLRVGVTKLAGTGRLRDLLTLADAGAYCAADFVDAGMATTYGFPDTAVAGAARYLVGRLAAEGAEVIVAELGGDLWGAGIPAILRDPALSAAGCGLVLVPSDTMASLGVATWVKENDVRIPTVHGVPYRNVMAARERLSHGLGVEPCDPQDTEDLDRLCRELVLPALSSPAGSH